MDNKTQQGNGVFFNTIAHIYTDFPTKFGVPRQSGLVESLQGKIIFEKEYQTPEAIRGLEEYSHIWLLWYFSQSNNKKGWSPTVRPPRLGGNKRVGVFATRSPFRPNPIALSAVKLDKIEITKEYGPVLYVTGADIVSGTPIFDIKPYLPFADCYPQANGGFAHKVKDYSLNVNFPPHLLKLIPPQKQTALLQILQEDPRPSYHNDPQRIYGFEFSNLEIKFTVDNSILTVVAVENINTQAEVSTEV